MRAAAAAGRLHETGASLIRRVANANFRCVLAEGIVVAAHSFIRRFTPREVNNGGFSCPQCTSACRLLLLRNGNVICALQTSMECCSSSRSSESLAASDTKSLGSTLLQTGTVTAATTCTSPPARRTSGTSSARQRAYRWTRPSRALRRRRRQPAGPRMTVTLCMAAAVGPWTCARFCASTPTAAPAPAPAVGSVRFRTWRSPKIFSFAH